MHRHILAQRCCACCESHCTVSYLAITNRLSLKFLHLNYHSWIIIWVAHCVLRALGFPALSWSQITVYVEFQLFFLCLCGFPSGDVVSSPYPQNFVLFYVSFFRYWKEPVIFQYALQHSHLVQVFWCLNNGLCSNTNMVLCNSTGYLLQFLKSNLIMGNPTVWWLAIFLLILSEQRWSNERESIIMFQCMKQ